MNALSDNYSLSIINISSYRNWPANCYRENALTTTKMILIAVSIYLIVTFFLTLFGIEKQNEGLKIFILSLLLTPVVGFFYIMNKKKNTGRIHYSYCCECDYIFPVKMKNCPCCAEEGRKVKLERYVSPYNIGDKIQMANFV